MKRSFYLIVLFFSLAGFRQNSSRIISGTVYSVEDKNALAGVSVRVAGASIGVQTDVKGNYSISIPEGSDSLSFTMTGYEKQTAGIPKTGKLDIYLKPGSNSLNEVKIIGYGTQKKMLLTGSVTTIHEPMGIVAGQDPGKGVRIRISGTNHSDMEYSESYKKISDNGFLDPRKIPLSTFAADVDAASYSNVRRYINNGQFPPKHAVRTEEMINYFKYELAGPANEDPVAIYTELSKAPWSSGHQLLRIGLKARNIETARLPSSNLVFLIDVSGSMYAQNKLPLVQASLKMLVDQLREKDHVAIVTYAGAAGLNLPSTSGTEKNKIKAAIDALNAGGSTAGGAGIKLAYKVAQENFIKGGSNRIILVTDGDFNVGASSDEDMETLIARERESGVSISVLGFGMGNLKDSKMETIADKGHGNYAYIDNITEARKAMVSEFGATLFTVAKDVKIQIEFNPAKVRAYRLLGYENRLLEKEDFNNDKKLGGDMGAGHTVTALYEIIPVGVKDEFTDSVDPLKYQATEQPRLKNPSQEVATVKFRYKDPQSDKSKMKQVVQNDISRSLEACSDDFRFASAVAELGMLLRNSEYKQQSDYENLIARAKSARGKDEEGYRAEFIRLAESIKLLEKGGEMAKDK